MDILNILEERGLVESVTSQDLALPKGSKVYAGFDPTADSLHLGNLVGIIVLGWFSRCGHTPVALVGGATGLIGDPSGKSHERPLLTPEQIRHNLEGIRQNIETVLGEVWVVNNYDWFEKIGFIEFLRDVGKFCRMGPMLGKEMVRTRLESSEGLSYTEFSYQLLQAYDFVHLFDDLGVVMQVGGSDQWGNITAGTELVRKLRGETVHGLTFPLLTSSDGKKLGKTEKGALWLSGEKCSPYEFYQYLYRTQDADVLRLMRMITYMEMSEIHEWKHRMEGADYVPNSAQKRLAEEVTRLVHGDDGVQKALEATKGVSSLDDLDALDIPSKEFERDEVCGMGILDLLVATELVASKGEARRLIRNGGVNLNNQKIEDENLKVDDKYFLEGKNLLVSLGKKRKFLVKVTSC